MVFDMMTGNCPKVDSICGLRIVQKSKTTEFKTFRIEVWVKSGEETHEDNVEIKNYLETSVKGECLKDTTAKDCNIKWQPHA